MTTRDDDRDEGPDAPFTDLERVALGEATNAAADHDQIPGEDRDA